VIIVAGLTASASIDAQNITMQANPKAELISAPALHKIVEDALSTFYTPGAAVGVVYQGKIAHLAGYGLRDMAASLPVNPYTQFRLASTSKAFTAASVAILVDAGKLDWNDRVSDHLPAFALHDPKVTREFRIIDLLTHRSGLVSGAGDAMIWPEPSGFSRAEVVQRLRYLTPAYSFRQTYSYSNVLYIAASEIVAQIADMPWAQFVDEQIFQPLGMDCYAGAMPKGALGNVATGYSHQDERGIYPVPRNAILGDALMSAPAGGVVCNAHDMLKWLQALLNEGKTPNGQPLFSSQQLDMMWQSHTLLHVTQRHRNLHQTHFRAFGIGWRKENIYGYQMFSHTGTLSGYQAYAALIPELELGVIVLNNGSNYGVRSAIMQSIIKSVMPEAPPIDWVDHYVERQARAEQRWIARYGTKPKGSGAVLLPAEDYLGEYRDAWYGAVTIERNEGGSVRFTSQRMQTLTGTLEPFDGHSWVIRWDNPNAASDAFVHFTVADTQKNKQSTDPAVTGFSLHPFQLEEEDDHNWRDMHFKRAKPALIGTAQ
jgi:CubicO group peptidase (beta-lactamase class C family)